MLIVSDCSISEIKLSGNSCRFIVPLSLRFRIIRLPAKVQRTIKEPSAKTFLDFWTVQEWGSDYRKRHSVCSKGILWVKSASRVLACQTTCVLLSPSNKVHVLIVQKLKVFGVGLVGEA